MKYLKILLTFVLMIAVLRSINGAQPIQMDLLIQNVSQLSDTIYDETVVGKALKSLSTLTRGEGLVWDDKAGIGANIGRNVKNITNAIKYYIGIFVFGTGTIFVDVTIVSVSILTFVLQVCGFNPALEFNPDAPPATDTDQSNEKPWWNFIFTPLFI